MSKTQEYSKFSSKLHNLNLPNLDFLENVTEVEASIINGGGRFPEPPSPWEPAEVGTKLTWGKCKAYEIIGPDGKCANTAFPK